MPPKKNTKTKKKSKKAVKPRRPVLRFLIVIFFLITLASLVTLTGLYIWVDTQVAEMLSNKQAPSAPQVLAEGLKIESAWPLTLEQLARALEQKNYSAKPSSALPTLGQGQFTIQGDSLFVVIRPYRLPDGEEHPSLKVQIKSGKSGLSIVASETNTRLYNIQLEPQALAFLGNAGQEIRASKHLPLSEIPLNMQHAIIAIEDERFYQHFGIDLFGIARAIITNIVSMRMAQGGSTLTQQLIKNMLLTPEKTLKRKIIEALGAISLERRLSKSEILELYLNEVYLGQDGFVALHGVNQAAEAFFGRPVTELSVNEHALIAGLIKAPSYFSPVRHPDRAKERQQVVLSKMQEQHYLSKNEFEISTISTNKLIRKRTQTRAAYYLQALNRELAEDAENSEDSQKISSVISGIDIGMQDCAETAVPAALSDLEIKYPKLKNASPPLQAALVAIEPYSGRVRAWVGGRDFSESQFDRVIQTQRQIGSTIKPFLYLTALDGSLNSYRAANPLSVLADEPTKISIPDQPDWEPENFDHKYRGDVTLRYALENSLNIPAIYLSERIGLPSFARTLRHFRLGKVIPQVPSLALGAFETNLLQLTAAYAALANGGEYIRPRVYLKAFSEEGAIIASPEIESERVAKESAVYVLSDMLRGVVERGTAKSVRKLGYTDIVAGKTGTSNDSRDNWFVGYTPDLAVGVWVGFDDNQSTGLTGGAAAVPVWVKFMQCTRKFRSAFAFVPPPTVRSQKIDLSTGELATPNCPTEKIVEELFTEETLPRKSCAIHGAGETDSSPYTENSERRRNSAPWSALFGE